MVVNCRRKLMRDAPKSGEKKSLNELRSNMQKVMATASTTRSNNVFLPLPEKAKETIKDIDQILLIHAELQANQEEAAQERRHGREVYIDDGDWGNCNGLSFYDLTGKYHGDLD
jgi:hypothetical protein